MLSTLVRDFRIELHQGDLATGFLQFSRQSRETQFLRHLSLTVVVLIQVLIQVLEIPAMVQAIRQDDQKHMAVN